MHTEPVDTLALAAELAAAMPRLGPADQRLALTLYRLLARGRPVPPQELAERTGRDAAEVGALLGDWPGVFRESGRVVGFWGLALDGMPHRLRTGGRDLRTWCAWDALFLPDLLGAPATVRSTCPQTGAQVRLEVAPGAGVRRIDPDGAVLSFLRRDRPFDADTVIGFCHFVHFLRDARAARDWTSRHPGTFAMTIAEGAEVARLVNQERFGAALGGAERTAERA